MNRLQLRFALGLLSLGIALPGLVHCADNDFPSLGTTTTAAGGGGAGGGGGGHGGQGGQGGQDDAPCKVDADCGDGKVCEAAQCLPDHCTDMKKSGDESDADCGGSCLGCDNDDKCGAATDCQSGFCSEGSCAPCAGNDDCSEIPDTFCKEGTCSGSAVNGEDCTDNFQCQSGFCVDAVCCNANCNDTCESCVEIQTGQTDGTCAAVLEDTDPDGECGDEGQKSCGSDGSGCNGDAAAPGCKLYQAGTECAPAGCTNGMEGGAATCDGKGTCSVPNGKSCGAYKCDNKGEKCLTTCSGHGDCTADNYCSAGKCVPKKQNGDSCDEGAMCKSGLCPGDDSICCDKACNGTCESCLKTNTGANNGSCSFIKANTDPDNECTDLLSPNCNGAGKCG